MPCSPSRTGTNVEAVIEPAGKAERELILSGHHDSAPVARIFSGPFSRFYVVAILAPYLFFVVELVLLLVRLSGRLPRHPVDGCCRSCSRDFPS